jgi:Xaa-Pro aminopeptidase
MNKDGLIDPPYCDFDIAEYAARFKNARQLMAQRGMDALLVSEQSNYIYFTGHRSVQNPIDRVRPFLFLLPLEGNPVVVHAGFEAAQVRLTCVVPDQRAETRLLSAAKVISELLAEKGLTKARIGCELGTGQVLGLSYLEFEQVRNAHPGADFLDASSLIERLRVIKSDNEIAYLKEAGRINAQVQADMIEFLRPGLTEVEIAQELGQRLYREGAQDITFLSVISPEKGLAGIHPAPSQRKIAEDAVLGFDIGVSYKGYCSDIARSFFIGKSQQGDLDFYDWMMELNLACIDKLRPGNSPCEVVEVCDAFLSAAGRSTMGGGRIGHGVGLFTTEYPSLTRDEDIVFEPGMVLACNPNFVTDRGLFNSEDNWAITDSAPMLLSAPQATRDLVVIS